MQSSTRSPRPASRASSVRASRSAGSRPLAPSATTRQPDVEGRHSRAPQAFAPLTGYDNTTGSARYAASGFAEGEEAHERAASAAGAVPAVTPVATPVATPASDVDAASPRRHVSRVTCHVSPSLRQAVTAAGSLKELLQLADQVGEAGLSAWGAPPPPTGTPKPYTLHPTP